MANDGGNDTTVENPVLRGFNPDPSITMFQGEYVIATSTFEWFPGIRLHRSPDLLRWTAAGHALDEGVGLDLAGIPDSGGIWAPSITVVDNRIWLAYSVVHTMDGDDLDAKNYLTTSDSIDGPWTQPVFLGSRGFDFSFFHDDDGRHWLVGVRWDHRPDKPSFSGIVLEEFLVDAQKMSGESHVIFQSPGLVEGPNLYKIDGTYLLTLAEGGTGWNHGITAAQSTILTGPYQRDPASAVLTSRDAPGLTLQKAGHGELIYGPNGELVLVHLAARPVLHEGHRYSTLGRETCLQRMRLDSDGWPRLAGGGHHAFTRFSVDGEATGELGGPAASPVTIIDEFWRGHDIDRRRWSSLRQASTFARPAPGSGLRLLGGESAASLFNQSLIGQRVTEHAMRAEAIVEADPPTFRQSMALTLWYDTRGWFALEVTRDSELGRVIRLTSRIGGTTTLMSVAAIQDGPVRLLVSVQGDAATFSYAVDDSEPRRIGDPLPAWKLSDDYGDGLRFTGLFVGVRADDLDGSGWHGLLRTFVLEHR